MSCNNRCSEGRHTGNGAWTNPSQTIHWSVQSALNNKLYRHISLAITPHVSPFRLPDVTWHHHTQWDFPHLHTSIAYWKWSDTGGGRGLETSLVSWGTDFSSWFTPQCGLEAVCTPQCKLKGLTFVHKLCYLFFLLPHHLDQSFLCRLLPGKSMHTHKYQTKERTSFSNKKVQWRLPVAPVHICTKSYCSCSLFILFILESLQLFSETVPLLKVRQTGTLNFDHDSKDTFITGASVNCKIEDTTTTVLALPPPQCLHSLQDQEQTLGAWLTSTLPKCFL